MKRFLVKLGLLVLGLLIPLMLLEIGLRLWGFPASDIYRRDLQSGLLLLNPNKNIYVASECFRNTVATNSLGFHSKEYSLEKPAHTYRIAIIGDSFIEAQQVSLEDMISARLETKLNALPNRTVAYEVLPFGISSHGTRQNILYTQQFAMQFHPDLVIDAFVMNDPQDDANDITPSFNSDGTLKIEPVPVPPTSPIVKSVKKVFRKSVLVTTVRKKYQTLKSKSAPSSTGVPAEVEILMTDYSDFWKEAWRREDQLLTSFKKVAQQDGAQFMVVSLTNGYRVHPELISEFEKLTKGVAVDFDKPEKILNLIAGADNFPYLALTPIFRERARHDTALTVWSCDGHWNAQGHEWGAQALADYLVQNHILP
ncbi:MAG: hypothetical protein KW806_00210 [Candidatus Yanofskybacteria bacterium]|nr:hypothetical protein [Candidatus Yanofskybacteria bacterium]